MKRFLIIGLLAVAVMLALPGYLGMQTETHYQRLLERLSSEGVQIDQSRYQRNWFDASAEAQVRIPNPQVEEGAGEGKPDLPFTLESRISHGPFFARGNGLALIETRILFDGKPLFADGGTGGIVTLVGFDGASSTDLDFPASEFSLPMREGAVELRIAATRGKVDLVPKSGNASLEIHFGGLDLQGGDEKRVVIGSFDLQTTTRQTTSGLRLGNGTFSFDSFSVDDTASGTRVRMERAEISMESSEENELVQGRASYRLEKIRFGDEVYGPAQLHLGVERIPARELAELQRTVQELQQQSLPEDQQGMAILGVLMNSGPAFLKSEPRLTIDSVDVMTPTGRIEGRLSIQPRGLQWQEISDTAALIRKLDISLFLRMPERLIVTLLEQQARNSIEQQVSLHRLQGEEVEMPDEEELRAMVAQAAAAQLEQLTRQELIKRQGDLVVIDAALSGGMLTVNSKMLPLPF